MRCFSVYSAAVLFPNAPSWFVPALVAAHHLLADLITRRHGNGDTAVRSNGRTKKEWFKKVLIGYAFYQFLAVASHILPAPSPVLQCEMAYNAIIAIASSAFLMTLYRKRVIRGYMHFALYTACLLVSAGHIVRVHSWSVCFLTLLTFIIRINSPFRVLQNKYLVWCCFLLAYFYEPWNPVRRNAQPYLQHLASIGVVNSISSMISSVC